MGHGFGRVRIDPTETGYLAQEALAKLRTAAVSNTDDFCACYTLRSLDSDQAGRNAGYSHEPANSDCSKAGGNGSSRGEGSGRERRRLEISQLV